jgi:hypothetical protein
MSAESMKGSIVGFQKLAKKTTPDPPGSVTKEASLKKSWDRPTDPSAAREGTTEGTTGDSRYGRKASGGLQAMAQNLGRSVSCSFFQFRYRYV